ncbi:TPA: HAD family hydrolase [Candidatus Bathyarchaeota archaeon]|nr:HAD family hydrolase [Candidatus Bathyarchaeota archaeon]
MQGRKITIVSFDLDGTLVDHAFVDSVWFEEIPKLIAEKERISFKEALRKAKKEYDAIGEERIEWYDVNYWINKFGLNKDWREILEGAKHKIQLYPEVLPVLERLSQKFKLIVNSNCPREFLELELEGTGISNFFVKVFSSTSDFNQVRKDESYYVKVCSLLQVDPEQMVHVGDNWKFDFEVPSRVGIKALFLDRSGKKLGKRVIHDLTQLEGRLEGNL